MESTVMRLFHKLIEMGVFNTSWMPIVSKKYLIGVFLDRITVSTNDGPDHDSAYECIKCTNLVSLEGPTTNPEYVVQITWGENKDFTESELERILQAMVDTYPPELGDFKALGFSSMFWPNHGRLVELLDNPNPQGNQEWTEWNAVMEPGMTVVQDKVVLGNTMKSTLGLLSENLTGDDYIRSLYQRLRLSFNDDTKYTAYLQRLVQLQEMTSEEFLVDSRRSANELELMYPHREVIIKRPLGESIFHEIKPGHQRMLPDHTETITGRIPISILNAEIGDLIGNIPEAIQSHYIPAPDEPSPFGPDQENYVDNPWIVWKNQQEGYDAQHQGSTTLLREALIEQLKAERYRSQVDRESVPFELQTSSGKLSLGYVIHIRYSHPMEWEEAHNYGMSKIKQFTQSR